MGGISLCLSGFVFFRLALSLSGPLESLMNATLSVSIYSRMLSKQSIDISIDRSIYRNRTRGVGVLFLLPPPTRSSFPQSWRRSGSPNDAAWSRQFPSPVVAKGRSFLQLVHIVDHQFRRPEEQAQGPLMVTLTTVLLLYEYSTCGNNMRLQFIHIGYYTRGEREGGGGWGRGLVGGGGLSREIEKLEAGGTGAEAIGGSE